MYICITSCSDHEGGNVSAHTGHLVSNFISYLSFTKGFDLTETLVIILIKLPLCAFAAYFLKHLGSLEYHAVLPFDSLSYIFY